jgi:WD40 repeat protein
MSEESKHDGFPIHQETFSLGHTGIVMGVALSSDGTRALSSSADSTLRLWDLTSRKCIAVLEGHTGRVWSVGLSRDAARAVSGSYDDTMRLWDLTTRRCMAVFKGHTDSVLSVAISEDATVALSGSSDKTLRLWDLTTHQCLGVLEGHIGAVWSVGLSSDGKRALSGSDDKTLRLWDLSARKCLGVLEGHTNSVSTVALSRDAARALSGSSDNTLRLWDLTTNQSVAVLEGHKDSVMSVALSSDGARALSGSSDNTLRIWDLANLKCLAVLKGHTHSVSGLKDHTHSVWGVALSSNAALGVSGSCENTLRLWDLTTHKCLAVLEGHTKGVSSVALSRDGGRALSGSDDNTLCLWDLKTGHCVAVLGGHTDSVLSVALSSDGARALSGSHDSTLRFWDLATHKCLAVLEGHTASVRCVALSSDGTRAVSGSSDSTLRLWDLNTRKRLAVLEGHTGNTSSIALSSDGARALSGSSDSTLRLWDLTTHKCLAVLEGHTASVRCVELSSDGTRAVSGSSDSTLRLWDLKTRQCLAVLEGHTDSVLSVALSSDGGRALSGSDDNSLRLWDLTTLQCLAILRGHSSSLRSVGFLDPGGRLAFSAAPNGVLRFWDLDHALSEAVPESIRYTNAKVVLVGESGVGKTALALRLSEDRWEATESTHGMTVSRMGLPARDKKPDLEREVWLWDFAGQPDYRLIHQLYMDQTALALLVFDPQDDNPFEALGHWEKAVNSAARARGSDTPKIMVSARGDRGGITISKSHFDRFCKDHDIAEFCLTGAKTGEGCEELKAAIARHIPWDKLPSTTTTDLFKSLKDASLKLKEEGMPLVRLGELHRRLQLILPEVSITSESLRTIVGLMQGQGIVQMLDFGEFVLLQPEQINRYASIVVRMAREHTDEMGLVREQQVLDGKLDYKDMARLSPADEQILLRAMVQTLLDRALCLRETVATGNMLVFPSYFRRDRPEQLEYPNVFVTYGFAGPLDEIYSTLVVKVSYSDGFEHDQLWKDAADFKTHQGKRVGLAMRRKGEGSAELVAYFEPGVPDDTKVTFIKYVHEHLKARARDVTRVRSYVCPNPDCNIPLENRRAIEIRLNKGLKDIMCPVCENRVILIDLIESNFASDEFARRVREMDEQARINLDNESRELVLVGHAFVIAGEAGQIFRPTPNSDWGIDGEIEFKDHDGKASAKRLYLQLKSGDSYLRERKRDEKEIFTIKDERWAEYWQAHAYPVMLVIRTSNGEIRWMNVTEYLKRHTEGGKKPVKHVVFDGEPFSAENLRRMRDRIVPAHP